MPDLPDTAANRPRAGQRAPLPSAPDVAGVGITDRKLDRNERVANNASYADTELFDCGTLLKLQTHPPPSSERGRNIFMRACFVVLAGWLPLALLAAYQSLVLGEAGLGSFLSDFAVHCRSLIAAPLLILAERICLPRLTGIAFHFREFGIVAKVDEPRFDAAWTSTLRLGGSTVADIARDSGRLCHYRVAGVDASDVPLPRVAGA